MNWHRFIKSVAFCHVVALCVYVGYRITDWVCEHGYQITGIVVCLSLCIILGCYLVAITTIK